MQSLQCLAESALLLEGSRESLVVEVQVEHVVVQRVKNAVEASIELSSTPEVLVGLRETPAGIELSKLAGLGLADLEDKLASYEAASPIVTR